MVPDVAMVVEPCTRDETLGDADDAPVVKMKDAAETAIPEELVAWALMEKEHSVLAGRADRGVTVYAVLVLPDVTAEMAILLELPHVSVTLLFTELASMASENVSVYEVLRSTSAVPEALITLVPCTREDTVGVEILLPSPQWEMLPIRIMAARPRIKLL